MPLLLAQVPPQGWACLQAMHVHSGFPPFTKTNISEFQFDQYRGPGWKQAKADVASSPNIVLVIYEEIT